MNTLYTRPVCGYPDLAGAPQTESGGSYDICWPRGFKFGVTDDDPGYTYAVWRQVWIERSMPWDAQPLHQRPRDWDPAGQLTHLFDGDAL